MNAAQIAAVEHELQVLEEICRRDCDRGFVSVATVLECIGAVQQITSAAKTCKSTLADTHRHLIGGEAS